MIYGTRLTELLLCGIILIFNPLNTKLYAQDTLKNTELLPKIDSTQPDTLSKAAKRAERKAKFIENHSPHYPSVKRKNKNQNHLLVINPADIRIDTYRASGAGGQHINKTDSAVRITHAPTGIVVECQDDRSQHRNKAQAMSILGARIKDAQIREQESRIASERKSLIGSGDRSERIRTYNFPQGRITDHRVNLTLYKIDFIMDGDLTELIETLTAEHQADLLAQLDED